MDSLRYFGVDTSKIVRGGDRVGIYFLEKGASQRGSVCIYDRANSAIALASKSDFNWDEIFDGADWFHFTGITPALGKNVAEICLEACKAAKAKGVKFGRPETPMPENFDKIIKDWDKGKLSTADVLNLCGMSESTFYCRR